MALFIICSFLSAFLLFQVQPMIGRYILPFFGGTPAVWSTVQLFFQVFLTSGYAYSAWLISRIAPKKQSQIHISLLIASLVLLAILGIVWPSPLTPGYQWATANVNSPILDIFRLLVVSVGFPYFLLSTNSSLMQAWFHRLHPGRPPYWLYALSNTGSLLGLLAYPFLIEPSLTVNAQAWLWSGGFAVFVVLAGWGAIRSARAAVDKSTQIQTPLPSPAQPPARSVQTLWIMLSALASTILLAITSQITQEVASIPFLWVLPLSIYLLSFILTYSGERWYNRKLFGGLLILATLGLMYALVFTNSHYIILISIYCFILFVCAMICNGETYRLRPASAFLTRFYLMTSIGGALGGIAVNLIAPILFKGYWELPISLGLVWSFCLAIFLTRKSTDSGRRIRFLRNILVMAALLFTSALSVYGFLGGKTSSGDVFEGRNFYGVTRVKEANPGDADWHGYYLVHGITIHGLQFSEPEKQHLPTTYFTETSGVGLTILNLPRDDSGLRVGVLGLGMGTLAGYAKQGDVYRMYEINPMIKDLAWGEGGYFSVLKDSPAELITVLGDARLSLEREFTENGSNQFNLLVLDVFSSDSIPVHLVTKEAFDIYLKHLNPDGILAANISNRYLDLKPVLWQLAKYYKLNMVIIESNGDGMRAFPSRWALLSRSADAFTAPAIAAKADTLQGYSTNIPLWTDDYSNLFQILN